MKKQYLKAIALLLAIGMMVGSFSGCKDSDNSSSDPVLNEVEVDIPSDDSSTDSSSESTPASSEDEGTSSTESTPSTPDDSSTPTSKKDTSDRDLKGRTITFMAEWEEPAKGSSSFWNNYWKVKTNLQKKYNVKFKHVYGSGNWYDTWVASVMSGEPMADIICSQQDPYAAYKAGLLYNVKSLKTLDLSEDKWVKAVNTIGTIGDAQYALYASKYIKSTAIMYNKDIFKKNGVEDLYTLQKNGKLTLDKFISIATELQSKTKKASILPGTYVYNVHKIFTYANGGRFITRTGTDNINLKATINSSAVSAGFTAAQNLVNLGVVESNIDGTNWLWSREQFAKGNYPILISGDLQAALEQANFEVGAIRIPSVSGGTADVLEVLDWCGIAANTKNPEDVGFVFDKMAEVIFTCDYESRFQDIASDDVMELIRNHAKDIIAGNGIDYDYACLLNKDLWTNGVGQAFQDMTSGKETPANTILTVEGIYSSQITNKYGK